MRRVSFLTLHPVSCGIPTAALSISGTVVPCLVHHRRRIQRRGAHHDGLGGASAYLIPHRAITTVCAADTPESGTGRATAAVRCSSHQGRDKKKRTSKLSVRVIKKKGKRAARDTQTSVSRASARPSSSVSCHSARLGRPIGLSPFDALRIVKDPANKEHAVRDEHGQLYVYEEMMSSTSSLHANACASGQTEESTDAASHQAVRSWLHPSVLHRRLRAVLVQHLLLTPVTDPPHTADTLIEAMLTAGLDATTLYMADWSAYAMAVYERYERAEAIQRVGSVEHDPFSERNVSWEKEEKAEWMAIGERWSAVRRHSIVHMVSATPPCDGGLLPRQASINHTRVEEENESAGHADVVRHDYPGKHSASVRWSSIDLIRALSLAIPLSDPYFRVAAHSGHVCYPSLPSTMLLTWNMSAVRCPSSWLPTNEGDCRVASSPLFAPLSRDHEVRSGHPKGSTVDVLTALRLWAQQPFTSASSRERVREGRSDDAYGPKTVTSREEQMEETRTSDTVYLCDTTAFLWLSAVRRRAAEDPHVDKAKPPAWTYMHSIWHTFSALHVDAAVGDGNARASMPATPQVAAHARRGSGCALVDAWVLYLDANVPDSLGCFASLSDQSGGRAVGKVGSQTGVLLGRTRAGCLVDSSVTATQTVGVGWDEAQHGAAALQDWVREAGSPSSSSGTSASRRRGGDGGRARGLSAETALSASSLPISPAEVATDPFVAEHLLGEGTGSLSGVFAAAAHQTVHLSAHLYRQHARAVHGVLTQLVAVPLTLSRLALALRWNARVDFATDDDNALLLFLLRVAANPQIAALHRRERQRRQGRDQLAPMVNHASDDGLTTHLVHILQAVRRDLEPAHPCAGDGTAHTHVDMLKPNSKAPTTTAPAPGVFRSQRMRHDLSVRSARGGICGARRAAALAGAATRPVRAAVMRKNRHAPPHITRLVMFYRIGQGDDVPQANARGVACRHFRGQPLRYVVHLRTDQYTPHEVLTYLMSVEASRLDAAMLPEADRARVRLPYYVEAEARLLCMPASDRILDRRFRLVAHQWGRLCGRTSASIRLGALAQLTLWGVEYPLPMAAEMLVLYLSTFDQKVHLTPPLSSGSACGVETVSSFVDWTVQFS